MGHNHLYKEAYELAPWSRLWPWRLSVPRSRQVNAERRRPTIQQAARYRSVARL